MSKRGKSSKSHSTSTGNREEEYTLEPKRFGDYWMVGLHFLLHLFMISVVVAGIGLALWKIFYMSVAVILMVAAIIAVPPVAGWLRVKLYEFRHDEKFEMRYGE